MKPNFSISRNKNLISIEYYYGDISFVVPLMKKLQIDTLTIFIDNTGTYRYYKTVTIDDFEKELLTLKESVLAFDGFVYECLVDKEIEVLLKSKLMINLDYLEYRTKVLVNNQDNIINQYELLKIFN